MPTQALSVMRTIRIQLKTGYRLTEPSEYKFMKKFPPIMHSNDENSKIEINIPYAKLFRQALKNSPTLAEERVYGAYSHLETRALTLAKKQYLYMQQGLTEKEAYAKALDYIGEVENKSFLEMKDLFDEINVRGGQEPFTKDPLIREELVKWQALLLGIPYEDLSLAEQGELDRFVQTRILKWSEVERERRMRDIVFYMQFQKLMTSLFPMNSNLAVQKRVEFQKLFTERTLQLFDLDPSLITTKAPFFVEDYLQHLKKAQKTPNLKSWTPSEIEQLSNWIINTLAYRAAVDGQPASAAKAYLTSLQDQFFPMFRIPSRAKDMVIPTVDDIKRLLYHNDIGYRNDIVEANGQKKLFVKRFYKLPKLLYPVELFCATVAKDKVKFEAFEEEEDFDVAELAIYGLQAEKIEVAKAILKDNADHINAIHSGIRTAAVEDALDMSVLDDIITGDLDLAEESEGEAEDEDDVDEDESDDDDEDEEEEEELDENGIVIEKVPKDSPEWTSLVKQYVGEPKTELEQERESFFRQMEPADPLSELNNELDLDSYQRERFDSELLVRSRLQRIYEEKESARLEKQFDERKLWRNELPPPTLKVGSQER